MEDHCCLILFCFCTTCNAGKFQPVALPQIPQQKMRLALEVSDLEKRVSKQHRELGLYANHSDLQCGHSKGGQVPKVTSASASSKRLVAPIPEKKTKKKIKEADDADDDDGDTEPTSYRSGILAHLASLLEARRARQEG